MFDRERYEHFPLEKSKEYWESVNRSIARVERQFMWACFLMLALGMVYGVLGPESLGDLVLDW